MLDYAPLFRSPKHTRLRVFTARAIAIAADGIQIGLMPFFGEGVFSPVNDVLDIAVAFAMTWLLGWNWVFLPSMVAELIPFVDLAPTWTLAVLFATRNGATETLPDDPNAPRAKPVISRVVE